MFTEWVIILWDWFFQSIESSIYTPHCRLVSSSSRVVGPFIFTVYFGFLVSKMQTASAAGGQHPSMISRVTGHCFHRVFRLPGRKYLFFGDFWCVIFLWCSLTHSHTRGTDFLHPGFMDSYYMVNNMIFYIRLSITL